MARFETVSNIIADAAMEVGLGSPTVSFTASDENVLQLLRLLRSTGRRLTLQHPWLQLRKEYTFTTTTETTYTLPSDFQSMVDDTGWNRSTMRKLRPCNEAEWQHLKASAVTSFLTVLFRPGYSSHATAALSDLPTIELPAAPSAGETIAFDYRSRLWVRPVADSATLLDAPTLETDRVLIDAPLIIAALKFSFLKAKGFDSAAAQSDFEDLLSAARSANVSTAPVLSLNAGGVTERMLDGSNAPGTGFGFDDGGLF